MMKNILNFEKKEKFIKSLHNDAKCLFKLMFLVEVLWDEFGSFQCSLAPSSRSPDAGRTALLKIVDSVE